MIELSSVSYAYPHSPLIFQEYTWKVERGQVWAILGPSGCGKTTLLYLLAGLCFPTGGQVFMNGQPLLRPSPQTGLILQEYGLLPWATVRQNAELGLRIRNFYGPDGRHAPLDYHPVREAAAWLERLGLAGLADQYPSQISGGQRQRTAIARTLALEPKLLLMDEPFSSLDAPTREALQSLTLELAAEQNLTLVIVTHAIEEAAFMGRNILILERAPKGPGQTNSLVLDNPQAGTPGYRQSKEYLELCQTLRERMESP